MLNIEFMIMGDSKRLGMGLTQLYKDISLKNYVNGLTKWDESKPNRDLIMSNHNNDLEGL